MPKISVIMPAYNAAKYISEAIESVLAQTYPVHEIIVVDDGSTDSTAEIVKKYMGTQGHQDTRTHVDIKYIYQMNKGPGAARNTGIKAATGEYIAFLDSDDVWMKEKIEKQMKLFKNSDYALIYCDMSHSVDRALIYKSYLKEKKYKYVSSGNIYSNLLKENFIFTPTVIVKKEILKKIGYFDESYKICEDYKMWLNIARKYHVGYLDEVLVERRRFGTNITKDKYLFITSGIRLFEELLRSNGHDKNVRKIVENEYYRRFFNLGYHYWENGDMVLARENFIKGMRYKKNILKIMPYVLASYVKCQKSA